MIASELILRRRAERILVVSTRAMLTQFQREFWSRFSIPLARLDSAAIKRMRNSIPASYNVFDQFDRAIVSIDTLKKDLQYRVALETSRWDLIIIDEAHNVAARKSATGLRSQRAKLADLLAGQTDALLLLTATPHDGSASSFASLIEMLDPTRVPNPEHLRREDIEDLVVRRFRSSPDVMADILRNNMFDDPANPGIRIATMHRAKGLEFDRVALALLAEDLLPPRQALQRAVDEAARRDILDREKSLLHVAGTRARSALRISWHGARPALLIE